jgi:hypothetical protein
MVGAAGAISCKAAIVNKRVHPSFTHDEIKAHSQRLKILRLRSDEDASGAGIRCRSGHGTADLPPILAKSSPFWAWSMLNAMFWRPPQNRMLARNALVLLLATVPATATATENDSQSANSIRRVATLGSRSSAEAAQRSAPMSFSRANVWASSAASYISHATFPFHQRPARLRT